MPRSASVLVLSLAIGSVGIALAQEAAPRYSIKQREPDTGTLIRRDVASGSVVPFDKRYPELSPREQAIVKSWYEQMGANDEPPFPKDGLKPIYQAIADAQQKLLVEGDMSLVVAVDSAGVATSVSVLRSADDKMTRFAAAVLMSQGYKPALCEGTPCPMQMPFRIRFTTRF